MDSVMVDSLWAAVTELKDMQDKISWVVIALFLCVALGIVNLLHRKKMR